MKTYAYLEEVNGIGIGLFVQNKRYLVIDVTETYFTVKSEKGELICPNLRKSCYGEWKFETAPDDGVITDNTETGKDIAMKKLSFIGDFIINNPDIDTDLAIFKASSIFDKIIKYVGVLK